MHFLPYPFLLMSIVLMLIGQFCKNGNSFAMIIGFLLMVIGLIIAFRNIKFQRKLDRLQYAILDAERMHY